MTSSGSSSRSRRTILILLLTLGGATRHASAMAMESFGNEALFPTDYRDWPGIMPIINDESRVYQVWVNGNEHFYYRGDTKALNDVLKDFAKVETARRTLIIRPGPGETSTLDRQPVPYDWNLHLVGGIVRAVVAGCPDVWDEHPTITIFVGGGKLELDELQIPDGLTVLELADLRARYRKALRSDDKHCRGDAACILAEVDADHAENVPEIATLLEDDDEWLRLMAAAALRKLGHNATSALPALKAGLKDGNERIRESFAKAIATIENAKADPVSATRRQETAALISQFVQALPSHARQPIPDGPAAATRPGR